MFLPLSRLKILRSSVSKGRTGPRRGSICLHLTSTLPLMQNTPIIDYPVIISIIRGLFIHYGYEQKMRAEVRDFINMLPCIIPGDKEKNPAYFLDVDFPRFLKESTVNDVTKSVLGNQDYFRYQSLTQYKEIPLQVENLLEGNEVNKKRLPFCVAVNVQGECEPLPLVIQAKLAIRSIHNLNFENTTMAVRRNENAEQVLGVLMNKDHYSLFMNSLQKGEEKYLPILRELQKITANAKRNALQGHAKRIQLLFGTKERSRYDKKDYSLAATLPDVLMESIFKLSHACKIEAIQEQHRAVKDTMERLKVPKHAWSALYYHNILKSLT